MDIAKLQVQTKIVHHNLAVILKQLCYGKISSAVLVPGVSVDILLSET